MFSFVTGLGLWLQCLWVTYTELRNWEGWMAGLSFNIP